MKRSLLFLSLLLLVALALCLAACGEGEPAETSNAPTTSNGTTSEVTTVVTTTFYQHAMHAPMSFGLLSDFYLYMEEHPEDRYIYEYEGTYIPANAPFPGKLIRVEAILPSLTESESVTAINVQGHNRAYDCCNIYYQYEYAMGGPGGFNLFLSVEMLKEFALPTPAEGETHEWNEELECLLVKEEIGLTEVRFYSLDGYCVTLFFFKSERGRERGYAPLLASDVTEVREILENPTFSCERLRIISETLRAMNEE